MDEAVTFLCGVLNLYNFDNDSLYVSFNGGKDATVVLYLTVFAMRKLNITSPIKCIYLEESNPFPEVDEFVNSQIKQLNLSLSM